MRTEPPFGQSETGQASTGLSRRKILLTAMSAAGAAALIDRVNPAMAATSATPIYVIRQNGDMLFYTHAGTSDGSANWPIQAKPIGNGWDFREVMAGI
ncbi:hypothetical protein LRS73_14480 [Methylobacterium currus]|uniref:hypothetical protein n=1 Tax=Methylobacterium currus TaxID=2051553 RepID=UPI001E5029F5|nr:hypothetical protein [Methylobacterium currus]UHC13801.1 hypothetical protein LRS73_14480 [Methylobacterium currus]